MSEEDLPDITDRDTLVKLIKDTSNSLQEAKIRVRQIERSLVNLEKFMKYILIRDRHTPDEKDLWSKETIQKLWGEFNES